MCIQVVITQIPLHKSSSFLYATVHVMQLSQSPLLSQLFDAPSNLFSHSLKTNQYNFTETLPPRIYIHSFSETARMPLIPTTGKCINAMPLFMTTEVTNCSGEPFIWLTMCCATSLLIIVLLVHFPPAGKED